MLVEIGIIPHSAVPLGTECESACNVLGSLDPENRIARFRKPDRSIPKTESLDSEFGIARCRSIIVRLFECYRRTVRMLQADCTNDTGRLSARNRGWITFFYQSVAYLTACRGVGRTKQYCQISKMAIWQFGNGGFPINQNYRQSHSVPNGTAGRGIILISTNIPSLRDGGAWCDFDLFLPTFCPSRDRQENCLRRFALLVVETRHATSCRDAACH